MDKHNRYMQLLEKFTIEELQCEANAVRDCQPEKAAMVYDFLTEVEPDFIEKIRYQRLANCYANIAHDTPVAGLDWR